MRHYQAIPYVLLLGFLFGSSLVVSRFSVGQYAPLTYISLRLLLAALGHLAIYGLMRPRRWPTEPRLWLLAGGLGVLGSAIPMTAIVSSLQYQSSGVTSLLLTLNPVATVLMAQLFLQDEPLTVRKLAGAVIAFGGAGVLLLRGESGLAQFAQADWRGYAWVGVGVLASASGSVYARRFLRHANAWDVASIRMMAAALVMLPITGWTVGYDLSRVNWQGYAALGYAALVGTFLAMWLSFTIVKRFGATPASQTSYVMPVVSTLLGAALLGEQITHGMILGMGVIFAGLSLLNSRGPTGRGRRAPSEARRLGSC